MFIVYILYSATLNKYYIGFTGDSIEKRLTKHLCNHKGFTARAPDWKVVYTENVNSKSLAMKREKEIKNWKNRKMVEKLIALTE